MNTILDFSKATPSPFNLDDSANYRLWREHKLTSVAWKLFIVSW